MSKTFDCLACRDAYFIGPKSGPPPYRCQRCPRELFERTPGSEPFQPSSYAAPDAAAIIAEHDRYPFFLPDAALDVAENPQNIGMEKT